MPAAVFFRYDFFAGPKTRSPHRGLAQSPRGMGLQSSGKVDEKGEVLSSPWFQPKGWYTVTVPTTVVAALVEQKVYPDPVFGTNLRSSPASLIRSGPIFPIFRCSKTALYRALVVSQGICSSCQLQGKKHLAQFRRDQLPREHLAERQADRQVRRCCRRMANL